ncbi:Sensor histidine kinase ComP [compost metagenome]
MGLIVAVQKLIKNLDKHPIEFHFLDKGFARRLPVDLEYQIYNITLELINNILKHSKATQAWISLSHTGKQVALTVSDNGIGLRGGAGEKGVGLTNIRSRVEQLKGQTRLVDSSERGAAIHIWLPVS